MVVNKQKLAEILGISEATLTNWQREGLPMVPRGKTGKSNHYETKEVIGWMLARERGTDLTAERTRLAKEQADKTALENALRRKELLPADEVQRDLEQVFIAVRSRLLSLPTKLAPRALGRGTLAEMRDVLDDGVREALNELAALSGEDPSRGRSGRISDTGASPKANRKPVG